MFTTIYYRSLVSPFIVYCIAKFKKNYFYYYYLENTNYNLSVIL